MLRILFYFILVAAFSASAEAINLHGVVSNTNGKPIPDAIVSLVIQDLKDTTNANGEFSFISTSVKKYRSVRLQQYLP